jgi:hypothetical protein
MSLNAVGKAFTDIKNLYDKTDGISPLSDLEAEALFKQKNPSGKPVNGGKPNQSKI